MWLSEWRALKAEVMWQPPTTTSTHLIWLLSRCSVSSHLRHSIGGTSTCKSEEYSVRRVSDMIQDNEEEQESDDKDLERW